MNKLLLYTAVVLLLFSSCQSSQEHKIEQYLHTFVSQYPACTLQDIYKGCFQDVFGPAHILSSRDAAKNYILRELSMATQLQGPVYEPCGWQGNFYRVNLSVIKNGKLTVDELVDALMDSAENIDTTLTTKFIEDWHTTQSVVKRVIPDLQGYSRDSLFLDSLLNQKHYVVHHSATFNEHYQPHYRIIRKDVFEEKILPKLCE